MQAHSIFSQSRSSEVTPLLPRNNVEASSVAVINPESSDIIKEIDDVLSILEAHLMTEDMIAQRECHHVGTNAAIFISIIAFVSAAAIILIFIFESISNSAARWRDYGYDAAKNSSDVPALKSNAEQSYSHMRLWLGIGVPGIAILGAAAIAMTCLCRKVWRKHKANELNANLLKHHLTDTEFQQVMDLAMKIDIVVSGTSNIKNLIGIFKEKKYGYEFEKNKTTIGLAQSVKKLLPSMFTPSELIDAEVIEVAAEPDSIDVAHRV